MQKENNNNNNQEVVTTKDMDYENEQYSWIPFLDEDDPLPGQCCPYATTSPVTIERSLIMINCDKDDILLDVGCGDGRIAIYAAKHYGIKSIGIDVNPDLIEKANSDAKEADVSHLVLFKVQSFAEESFDFKLSTIDKEFAKDCKHIYPTIITCYLIPKALKIIEPRIKDLVRHNCLESTTSQSEILTNTRPITAHKDIRVALFVFEMERWKTVDKDDKFKIFTYSKVSIDVIPTFVNTENPYIM
ncbi:hypothetical protein PPL_09838 [Heterostelium album PN500]|uniref:Methyltransferase domain-containing protein n=1 Tax=Heterostelium pallidum (strain ATCC 26659 / Pp 5 / PN500) TaxID=670386 RepID=D3BP75_HETP5|nr:hypothetical protein PPL_09838 [Heterostelium album PN500]EFA77085.1 hypothetical protein PPL_09838 [Heterostelium album PN500]|eukprot:XP_020429214.1 hypothetical protein PPL_09838 [Heterostelium album PN500]